MPHLSTIISTRDFQGLQQTPGLALQVESCSDHVVGGPEAASIAVGGTESAMWDIIDWLRRPVELYDEVGDLCWYGYVHAVEVSASDYVFGASLDQMYNRIAVSYSQLDDGQTTGNAFMTPWASDTRSQGEYGIREAILQVSDISDDLALAYRDTQLAVWSLPRPSDDNTLTSGRPTCKGWWETLAWRYRAATT